MSKAVLVLPETFENCYECDFCVYDVDDDKTEKRFCGVPGLRLRNVEDCENYRPQFCPVRSMPETKMNRYSSNFERGYNSGWNDCLRAIEGSEIHESAN